MCIAAWVLYIVAIMIQMYYRLSIYRGTVSDITKDNWTMAKVDYWSEECTHSGRAIVCPLSRVLLKRGKSEGFDSCDRPSELA